MPAKDLHHKVVVEALINDGWTITDDPLFLSYGGRGLYVDLGAEKSTIAAQKDEIKIAVEVKSFLRPSAVDDLQKAVGQYGIYRSILEEIEPARILYLSVPKRSYDTIFSEKLGKLIIKSLGIKLLVFDEERGGITEWIN